MNVFEKHQLAIAKKTLSYTDEAVFILGGMTKEEAKQIIEKLEGKKNGKDSKNNKRRVRK